jgi:hypothetical protein
MEQHTVPCFSSSIDIEANSKFLGDGRSNRDSPNGMKFFEPLSILFLGCRRRDEDSATELLSGTTPVHWVGANYQTAETEKDAFLNQHITDEILGKENEVANSSEQLVHDDVALDEDALFEQLLHRAEQSLSSNQQSQHSQSYASPKGSTSL